jgi:hypothetical protein
MITDEQETEQYDDSFSGLDPMLRFAVVFAALVFLGVVIEGLLLTPWTLILHGWIPSPDDVGGPLPPVPAAPIPAPAPPLPDSR